MVFKYSDASFSSSAAFFEAARAGAVVTGANAQIGTRDPHREASFVSGYISNHNCHDKPLIRQAVLNVDSDWQKGQQESLSGPALYR